MDGKQLLISRKFPQMKSSIALVLALIVGAEGRKVEIFKKETVEALPFVPSNKTHVVHHGSAASGFCDMVTPELPTALGCTCVDESLGGTIKCTVPIDVAGSTIDTVGVVLSLQPCADPMTFSFEMTEATENIDYTYDIAAGEAAEVPVPGISWEIPGLGAAGAYMDIAVSGNVEKLQLSLGIDACVDTFGVVTCASTLDPADFPIWILDEAFDFSTVCEA